MRAKIANQVAWTSCAGDRWCVELTKTAQSGRHDERNRSIIESGVLIASLGALHCSSDRRQRTKHGLSQPAHLIHRGICCRRLRRHDWALGCDQAGRAYRANRCGAEHGRRRRCSCCTTGRDVAAGWLHHPRNDDIADDQRIPGAKSRLYRGLPSMRSRCRCPRPNCFPPA